MRSDDPRIEKLVQSEQFHHFPGTTITVCAVKLYSGQQVVGFSIGRDTAEVDLIEGQKRARETTRRRIAGLESYRERVARHEGEAE